MKKEKKKKTSSLHTPHPLYGKGYCSQWKATMEQILISFQLLCSSPGNENIVHYHGSWFFVNHCHSLGKVNDHWRGVYFLFSRLWCCCPCASVNMSKKGQGSEWKNKHIFMGPCLMIKVAFSSAECLVPDLGLYSVPVDLLRFRDTLSLQLLEHSSAWWKRAVDITQKSLRVGVTVLDKAVIQLLQLIRKTYFSGTKTACFIQIHNRVVLSVKANCVCVYCNGWGMLTGCSC